jgi:predicted Zn-dependent protease
MKKAFAILLFAGIFTCLVADLAAQGQGQTGGASFSGRQAPFSDVSGALSEMEKAFETHEEDFTPEDEYYLGRAVAAQLLKIYRPYTGNPELVSYLNKICQAITLNSLQPEPFNGYHVGILDTRELNAFATPGGHIFLTLGLVECLDSEDALAAVIAHETAHIQFRHAAAIIRDQQLAGGLLQTADRAASLASRNAGRQERAILFGRNISVMVNTLFKNGFAQEQEFEADAAAIRLLRNTGYDPSALVTVLKILEQLQPLRPGGFNTTHPSPAARLANLERVPMNGMGRNTRAYREPRFTALLRGGQEGL